MLTNYYPGMPAHFGEAVGRVTGPVEGCAEGYVNGVLMPARVYWRTPHGTVIKTGIAHLKEMTVDGMERLLDHEASLASAIIAASEAGLPSSATEPATSATVGTTGTPKEEQH